MPFLLLLSLISLLFITPINLVTFSAYSAAPPPCPLPMLSKASHNKSRHPSRSNTYTFYASFNIYFNYYYSLHLSQICSQGNKRSMLTHQNLISKKRWGEIRIWKEDSSLLEPFVIEMFVRLGREVGHCHSSDLERKLNLGMRQESSIHHSGNVKRLKSTRKLCSGTT